MAHYHHALSNKLNSVMKWGSHYAYVFIIFNWHKIVYTYEIKYNSIHIYICVWVGIKWGN